LAGCSAPAAPHARYTASSCAGRTTVASPQQASASHPQVNITAHPAATGKQSGPQGRARLQRPRDAEADVGQVDAPARPARLARQRQLHQRAIALAARHRAQHDREPARRRKPSGTGPVPQPARARLRTLLPLPTQPSGACAHGIVQNRHVLWFCVALPSGRAAGVRGSQARRSPRAPGAASGSWQRGAGGCAQAPRGPAARGLGRCRLPTQRRRRSCGRGDRGTGAGSGSGSGWHRTRAGGAP